MVLGEIVVNQFIQSFSTPSLDLFFKAITYLGHPAIWMIIAAWLFWLGYERKSFVIMTIILFAGAIAGALKIFIARPRPEGIIVMDPETSYSYPSAHATLITSFAAFGWLKKKLSRILETLLVVAVIFVAVSRLYLGAHYVTDVIAGIVLGLFIGWVVYKAEAKLNKIHFHLSKIQDEFLVVGFFVIAVLFYLFIQNYYPPAYALFGYFAGYIIYKHSGIDLVPAKTTKQSIAALFIGTIILGVLYMFGEKFIGIESAVIFFIAGLFITVFWPAVIFKLVQKRETHKAKKIHRIAHHTKAKKAAKHAKKHKRKR
ncbi:Undecaprenyl-diphosphatase [uncultured archaeon]|nr:Undecaprenyl-diphosphatase [uncultured archaeon]